MTVTCPACGSSNVKEEKTSRSLPVPYGPPAAFMERVFTCADCDTSGDFTGENDAAVREAVEKSQASAAEAIFRWLGEQNVSAAYLERALRLPARTTARWKSGELSAAALALLRLVRTYPWLLKVADSGFESTVVQQEVVAAAAKVLASVLRETASAATVAVTANAGQE